MRDVAPYEHLVQYYETDKMQVVHHSNYIRWFEEARIYYFEQIGLGYKHMEDIGIVSPVVGVTAKYKTMCKFFDKVKIDVKFTRYTGVRLFISYEIRDALTDEIRCTGESEHCFINNEGNIVSLKKVVPELSKALESYIE